MPIIINEVDYAKRIIEKGIASGDKPFKVLSIIGRYYRQKEGLSPKATCAKLTEFMKKHYKHYNEAIWEGAIENISVNANKIPLRELPYIGITQKELDTIRGVKNLKYEKLLFTMLCYAKLYNACSQNNNDWVNTKISELCTVAKVQVRNKDDKFIYMNDLESLGYISFSEKNNNRNLKVNFIDTGSDFVLKISDFRELGYEYMSYIGSGRFIRCVRCGRMVKLTNDKDFSRKYCAPCARIIKNEQNKKYYKAKLMKSKPC